jgi:hypothetical protein
MDHRDYYGIIFLSVKNPDRELTVEEQHISFTLPKDLLKTALHRLHVIIVISAVPVPICLRVAMPLYFTYNSWCKGRWVKYE